MSTLLYAMAPGLRDGGTVSERVGSYETRVALSSVPPVLDSASLIFYSYLRLSLISSVSLRRCRSPGGRLKNHVPFTNSMLLLRAVVIPQLCAAWVRVQRVQRAQHARDHVCACEHTSVIGLDTVSHVQLSLSNEHSNGAAVRVSLVYLPDWNYRSVCLRHRMRLHNTTRQLRPE